MLNYLGTLVKNQLTIYMRSGLLFYAVDLYAYLTHCCGFCWKSDCCHILGPLHLHLHFRIRSLIPVFQKSAVILTGI